MSEMRNGRQMIGPVHEHEGMARAVKSGQVVATRASMITKLDRYIADPRKSDEDRAMYRAQVDDIIAEQEKANG